MEYKDDFLLNNILEILSHEEQEILYFSSIPQIITKDMLIWCLKEKFETALISKTIEKLTNWSIFSMQYDRNENVFYMIHDRIRSVINNFANPYFLESCKTLIQYYESYIKKEGVLSKQFYNDKLYYQLILGKNNEWRSCYQAYSEDGNTFGCEILLDIYQKALKTKSSSLRYWFQYYTLHNEFVNKKRNFQYHFEETCYLEVAHTTDNELLLYFENLLGLIKLNQGKYDDALKHLNNALCITSSHEKSVIYYNICVVYFYQEKYIQSMNVLKKMMIVTNDDKEFDLYSIIKYKVLYAVLNTKLYNLDIAIKQFDEIISLKKEYQKQLKSNIPIYLNHRIPRPIYGIIDKDIYNYMGEVFLIKGDFEKSIQYHLKGLQNKEAFEDILGMAWAHNDLGKVNYISGDTQNAEKHLMQSCKLFDQSGDDLSKAYPLIELSFVYQYNGEVNHAIETLEKSVYLFNKKKLITGMILSLNHLGRLYQSQGFLSLAEKIFNYCLSVFDNESFVYQTFGWIYNNLARNYLYLTNYDMALVYFQKAQKIFEEIGEKRGISYVINNIAEVKVKQFKYNEAQQLFLESSHTKEIIGDKHAICYTYREIGELYIKLGNLQDAYFYINRAFEICNERKFIMLKGDILVSLGNYYKQIQCYEDSMNFYIQALKNYQQQHFYSRTLFCINKIKELPCKKNNSLKTIFNENEIRSVFCLEKERLLQRVNNLLENLYIK